MSENSITLVAPTANGKADAANDLFDTLGFGRMLSTRLSSDGQEPASHLACHDSGPDERVAMYEALKESEDTALDPMDDVTIIPHAGPDVYFFTAIASLGLSVIYPPEE